MAISFEKALGIHAHALTFRAERAEVIANNMANSDTPNFKARDLDFNQVFADYLNEDSLNRDSRNQGRINQNTAKLAIMTTNENHHHVDNANMLQGNLLYRIPSQPSIDGNTVDEHAENAAFMQNSLDFQTSFTFLNGRFRGLMTAIRGE